MVLSLTTAKPALQGRCAVFPTNAYFSTMASGKYGGAPIVDADASDPARPSQSILGHIVALFRSPNVAPRGVKRYCVHMTGTLRIKAIIIQISRAFGTSMAG